MLSERKLKGLLTPNTIHAKQPLQKPITIKKSGSPSPSPTVASNSHKVAPNQGAPLYYGIPGVQNFFYYPIPQNEPIVQPSPWLEPFKLQSLKEIPLFSHTSAHTAADSRGDQTKNQIQMDNDCSNSLCSLVKRLNIQFPSQPKNLEELLQRSFASMPSYSALQSPMGPGFASPFIRSNTNAMGYQGMQSGSISDLSFRGSLAQKMSFSGSQTPRQKTTLPTDEGLIVQIADLISRENDGRIKSAITELLVQYGAATSIQIDTSVGGILSLVDRTQSPNHTGTTAHTGNLGLFGDTSNNAANNGASKPKTISLSSGLTMNAVDRNPQAVGPVKAPSKVKTGSQNPKVEAARRELFILSEFGEKRNNPFPIKQTETNDFNLFDFTHGPNTLSSQDLSPLISSAPLSKDGLGLNLINQPGCALTSHSISQQAASLSTNSSHSENQKGMYSSKKAPFELTGKFQISSTFRLIDDIPLQNKILDVNFASENWNKKLTLPTKVFDESSAKLRMKGVSKKSRTKQKVSVEEYVQHVHARSREDSNLTIEETWEDEENWSDEQPVPTEKKRGKVNSKK